MVSRSVDFSAEFKRIDSAKLIVQMEAVGALVRTLKVLNLMPANESYESDKLQDKLVGAMDYISLKE